MIQWIKEAWRSAVWGWIALGLVHITAAWTGIGLGVGWITCGTASLLGVPGITMLLLMDTIL